MIVNEQLPSIFNQSILGNHLDVQECTLERWRYLGVGPRYIKVGRLVRYKREDVEQWLDSQSKGGC